MTKLSKKERGFVKEYIKTGNGTQSALKVYDTKSYMTGAMIASENLKKPKIIKALQEMLPDDLLADRHLALLNKKEIVKGLEGEYVDIDTLAVSKGLDMAYKIKGSYSPEKSVVIYKEVEEAEKQHLDNLLKLAE